MKKVMIPTFMNPFVVSVNGKRYEYPAGTEQEVPDEVASIIEAKHEKLPDPVQPPFNCGGGVTSWNDLTDKPFGEEKAFEPIVWDGNIEGLESISVSGMTFYKIYGEYFEAESVESITANMNGEEMTAPGELYPADGGWTTDILICSNGQLVAFDMTFPGGLWVLDPAVMGLPEGTTFTIHPKTTVKTIDPKYLGGWEALGSKYENGVAISGTNLQLVPVTLPTGADFQIFPVFDIRPLKEGAEYAINWNGTVYNCVCSRQNLLGMGCYALGNIDAFEGVGNTGEPFVITVYDETFMGVPASALPLDGSTSLTFTVTGLYEIVTLVPDKYLPIVKPCVIDLIKEDAENNESVYGGYVLGYYIQLDTTELYKVMVNHGNIYFRISTNSGYVRHVKVSSYFYIAQNETLEEFTGDISKLPLQLGAYEPLNGEHYYVYVNVTD